MRVTKRKAIRIEHLPSKKSWGKKLTRWEMNWFNRYEELKDFKRRFGHCAVPQYWHENKALGMWVIRQRALKQNLYPEKIALLDKLGFAWENKEFKWERQFRALQRFIDLHGNAYVPQNPKFIKLHNWLICQKRRYLTKHPLLGEEQIQRLLVLGLNW